MVVDTVTTDDHVKPDTTLEGLSALRPAFGKDGTVTAGNASGIVAAAAAVVVSSKAHADSKGRPRIAEIVDWEVASVPPRIMGIGPVPAIEGVCRRAGILVSDVDRIEINEAFAAQYLGCEKLLKLDRDRVSVSGGGQGIAVLIRSVP